MGSRPRRRLRRYRPVLRPQPGHRLPRALRPNRVGRLAAAFAQGVEDPDFEVLLRRIDQAPLLGGNRVRLFYRGDEAFAAMREAIAAARSEVLVEFYILKDDATGRRFLEALAEAVARGVEVKLLADALGSFETRNAFWREMERRGIQVLLFHPLLSHVWHQLVRDHRKILVVDRRIAFTGGMNIGEEYGSPPTSGAAAASPEEGGWRDTHLRLEGPTAWELAVVFEEGWTHAGGEPLALDRLPAETAEAPGARALVLDSRPFRGNVESAAALAAILGAARRRVWITNAYFAPGHRAVRLLGRAARRGVDVRLLLPGWTDVPLLRHAAHGYYRDLLARGVRIFEYQGAVLHAKSLVADGYASVVGSTNLDFRSFVFNAECNLVLLHHATAAELERAFERDLERAEEIRPEGWRERTLPHRLLDRGARLLSPVL